MNATLTYLPQLGRARRDVSQLAVSRRRSSHTVLGGRSVPTTGTGRGTGLALGTNPFEGDNHAPAPTMWFCTIKRPAQHLAVRST